jgi:D-alanyl-D-alanine dipeptidase
VVLAGQWRELRQARGAVGTVGMRVIEDLEQLRRLPPQERQRVYLPEALSTRYPIAENGEPLLALDELFGRARLPVRLCPSDPAAALPLRLRRGAAERLLDAAGRLLRVRPWPLLLQIDDAYRSPAIQRQYFAEVWRRARDRCPDASPEALWQEVTRWVADPALCPPHCTGGAVDLTLAFAHDGQPLPMGTPVGGLDGLLDARSHTWCRDLRQDDQENRRTLFEAMSAAGFVNLATEWWHYSFGDQIWAALTLTPQACYGLCDDAAASP